MRVNVRVRVRVSDLTMLFVSPTNLLLLLMLLLLLSVTPPKGGSYSGELAAWARLKYVSLMSSNSWCLSLVFSVVSVAVLCPPTAGACL